MNKITMLGGTAALVCLMAPPTDDGGAAPLLPSTEPAGDVTSTAPEQEPVVANEEHDATDAATDVSREHPAPEAATPPKAAAGPRTQARLDPAKKVVKVGSRPRKAKSAERVEPESDAIVGIVLQTSRVNGADGRAIPRRTIALAKSARAEALIGRGWARAATEAEAETASVVLD